MQDANKNPLNRLSLVLNNFEILDSKTFLDEVLKICYPEIMQTDKNLSENPRSKILEKRIRDIPNEDIFNNQMTAEEILAE